MLVVDNFKMNLKYNFLLKFGTTIFCCAIILLFFFQDNNNLTNDLLKIKDFWIFSFFVLILAPILEEFCFRGNFVQNKYIKYTSLIFIFFYLLIKNSFIILIFPFAYFILFLIKELNFIKINNYYFYILNAFIFAIAHYDILNLNNIFDFTSVFIKFGAGLIFIWVTLNFGIIKSMFVHFFFNLIPVLYIFISIQCIDIEIKIFNLSNCTIEVEKTPIINKEYSKCFITDNNVSIKNSNLNKVFYYLQIDNKKYNPKDNPFYHYNLKIRNNDSLNSKLNNEKIIDLLLKADLLEKK